MKTEFFLFLCCSEVILFRWIFAYRAPFLSVKVRAKRTFSPLTAAFSSPLLEFSPLLFAKPNFFFFGIRTRYVRERFFESAFPFPPTLVVPVIGEFF